MGHHSQLQITGAKTTNSKVTPCLAKSFCLDLPNPKIPLLRFGLPLHQPHKITPTQTSGDPLAKLVRCDSLRLGGPGSGGWQWRWSSLQAQSFCMKFGRHVFGWQKDNRKDTNCFSDLFFLVSVPFVM